MLRKYQLVFYQFESNLYSYVKPIVERHELLLDSYHQNRALKQIEQYIMLDQLMVILSAIFELALKRLHLINIRLSIIYFLIYLIYI